MDLEFEIVRYWFYSRSNRDGIMRAFAQSAARGSRAGNVLPVLEDYHLLDKFSEDIEWDYRGPEQDVQELEQEQEEPISNSSTPATQRPHRTLSQQKRQPSDTKQPSDTSKAQTFDNRNTENRRVKATRRQSKNTRESVDELRRTSQKRGRPLGSFNKKSEVKLSPQTQTITPTQYPTPIIVIPRLISTTRAIAGSTEDNHSTPMESALSILLLNSTTNDNPSAGQEVDQGHI
ncbi:MAG: hypothetical protein J3R72DRAFT_511056 [Linnemannia gamsii]|nr:MAG: hypothetical protein J3R72DRAFT_511056 [Linnemannia gamsii]